MRNISKEEYEIASRYLFVDLTLSTIDVDLKNLHDNVLFKIKEVYINLLEKLQVIGTKERRNLKKLLKQEDIQIVMTTKRDTFTEYTIYCKGNEVVKSYFNPHIRNRVRDMMNEWLGKIEESNKSTSLGALHNLRVTKFIYMISTFFDIFPIHH